MSHCLPLQHLTGLAVFGGKQGVPEGLSPTAHDPVEEAEHEASRKRSVISHRSQHWTPSTGATWSPSQHLTLAPLHGMGVGSQMFFSLQVKPF